MTGALKMKREDAWSMKLISSQKIGSTSMWTIKRIDEADFGCEERMPGEPLMVLVSLESDDGRQEQLEVADQWLTIMQLDEGDEWPEELVQSDDEAIEKINRQSAWMDNYLDALDEMDEK